MSKIMKLREWLTVEEAAQRLTISAQEEVSEADLLRLALDGHLTLSVHFVNHAKGRPVSIERLDSEERCSKIREEVQDFLREHPEYEPCEQLQAGMEHVIGLYRGDELLDGEHVLTFEGDDQQPVTLEGVWDLLMLGAERLDVEHAYQRMTDGFPVELVCLGGPLVANLERSQCFQLLDRYIREARPDTADRTSSPAISKVGPEAINKMNRTPAPVTGKAVPEQQDFELDYKTAWYPAAGLPKAHTLVVRSIELRSFERKLLDSDAEPEKAIHPSERKSVSRIIAALAAMAELDLSAPYKADETLRASAAKHGIELPSSPETVVKFLKDAAART